MKHKADVLAQIEKLKALQRRLDRANDPVKVVLLTDSRNRVVAKLWEEVKVDHAK